MKELFVGYLPHVSPRIARLLLRTTILLLLTTAAVSVALSISQHRFPPSSFEFDHVRDFEGVIEERPYPSLIVSRPGVLHAGYTFSRYLLVGVGKHDVGQNVAAFGDMPVKLRAK